MPDLIASPVPDPVLFATNLVPTLLSEEPISVKSVSPTEDIIYSVPISKDPASTREELLRTVEESNASENTTETDSPS